jgi:hypothetical protein
VDKPVDEFGLTGSTAKAGAASRFNRQRPRRGESEAAEFGWVGVLVRGRPFL